MSPITIPAYLPTEVWRTTLDELMAAYVEHNGCLRTRIIEILGEAGVWPISCLEDRLAERQRLADAPRTTA